MRASPISMMLMTLVVIASACGSTPTPTAVPPTSAPTQAFTLATSTEEIVGTWHSRPYYIRFYKDGTLHHARALDSLDSQPYAINAFRFEGTQMFIKEISVSGVPPCRDTPGIYEVRLLEGDKIQIVAIEDKCSPRRRDMAVEYEPVGRTSQTRGLVVLNALIRPRVRKLGWWDAKLV